MQQQRPPNPPSGRPGYLEGHRLYRDRIVAEDQLIHYRTSWSIWIQTLLVIIVGALAVHISSKRCLNPDERLLADVVYWICALGAVVGVLSFVAIVAALIEINRLKARFEQFYPDYRTAAPWLPNITGSTSLHFCGHLVNTVGPILATLGWIYLGLKLYLPCS